MLNHKHNFSVCLKSKILPISLARLSHCYWTPETERTGGWEEQEEMQTEEHGEVEQEERQEERAFRQHEAQKNLRRRQVSSSPFES